MANELLNPRLNGARARQAQSAKEAQKAIEDRAELNGVAPPPYDFLELIGKGTFGRVYKGYSPVLQKSETAWSNFHF